MRWKIVLEGTDELGSAHEFMRRFLLHVLPHGFHRIRHYGLFASATRAWLRGRENIHKHYLIPVAGFNLGLLMRALYGRERRERPRRFATPTFSSCEPTPP